jgi:hypothetical protein
MRTVHRIKIIEPAWIILVIIIKYIIFTVVITLGVAYIIIVIIVLVVINIIIWVIICVWDLIVRMNVYNMSHIFLVVTLLWYGYWDCWFFMMYVIWQVIFYRWVTNTFTRLIVIVPITYRPSWPSSKLYIFLLMIIFIIIILGLIVFLIFDLR